MYLRTVKSGLTLLLMGVVSFSFAQRGEGRGGGRGFSGGGAARSGGGQVQQRSFSRPSYGAQSFGGGRSVQQFRSQAQPRMESRAMAYNNLRTSPRNYSYSANRAGGYTPSRSSGYAPSRAGGYYGGVRGGNYYRGGVRAGVGAYYRPHYSRPPMIYNGYRYYTHYTYSYHPYVPYYYGSYFHPFGYFALGLSPYAYEFAWENQPYWYDQGTYYVPYNNGYRSVPAPQGAAVNELPNGYATVNVNGGTYYYYAGTFYLNGDNGFEVVPAPPGAVVYDLPEGAKETVINGTTYVNYNDTWYLPITLDGKDAYEVVDVEKDDNF